MNNLKLLIKKKVKVILISHQGSYKKKDTLHLDFLIINGKKFQHGRS